MIVSGVLRTRKEIVGNLWMTNAAYTRPIFHATMAKD
jgi:hypothetical protein